MDYGIIYIQKDDFLSDNFGDLLIDLKRQATSCETYYLLGSQETDFREYLGDYRNKICNMTYLSGEREAIKTLFLACKEVLIFGEKRVYKSSFHI